MMSKIRIYDKNEIEFVRLTVFVNFVNGYLHKKNNYNDWLEVKTTYFDYGQDWKYSTIIIYEYTKGFGKSINSYQAFCPRDWELIINTDSISKLEEMAKYYVNLKESKEWNYRKSLYEKFE